jgi:hypothetical protein
MPQTDDIKMVVTHDRQERQPITFIGVPEIPSGISGVLRVDCNPAPRQFI